MTINDIVSNKNFNKLGSATNTLLLLADKYNVNHNFEVDYEALGQALNKSSRQVRRDIEKILQLNFFNM